MLACKVLNMTQKNKNDQDRQQAAREVEILQMIPKPHTNIVTLIAGLQTRSNLYLFMEYCDQGDLKDFIANRKAPERRSFLSEAESRYVLRDVVRGLAHLSKVCKIMHRDIKLDNILVKSKPRSSFNGQGRGVGRRKDISDFEFKLGDLGLAKNFVDESELQATCCGTPLYMAPEVINGYLYNHKADVWSLGTLLFQMLTGEYPFHGRDLNELKLNLKQGVYKIPKQA